VLIVVDLAGGGTHRVVAGLARAFREAGTRVTIVTNQTSDGRWRDPNASADVVDLPGHLLVHGSSGSPAVLRNVRWLMTGVRTIRRVLCSAAPETPVLAFLPGTNVLASFACIGLDITLILSERNDVNRQPLPSLLRIARRFLYRTASAVTTNRPNDLAALRTLAGRVPVHLVSNPPPAPVGRAVPSDSQRILSIGRLTSHKRHRDIVLAFGALAEEFPDWTLRVLGDGLERPALEALVSELDLRGRVELPGWSSDVAAELAQGAVLVHASEYEGTSNSVLEAMATGLPIVASAPSVPWPVACCTTTERDGARIFKVGDTATLTRHLRELLRDAELRDRLGEQASRRVVRLTADPLATWLPVIRAAMGR
jgi:GalNAc-alpha-(1->4)-GalNAc-alpha-(1->3)-diNAcBac-PP-undecaprenol alpha-1,4-N-acetyl-D-galactosaminyltransferase